MEEEKRDFARLVLNIHSTCPVPVLDVHAQALAARACSGDSHKETRTAPMLDTTGSCPLHWTHHRAKLSPPVRMVAPLGKGIYETKRTLHIRERRKGWRKVKETIMRTLSQRRRRKRCCRCWRKDFLMAYGENHARAETHCCRHWRTHLEELSRGTTALGKDPDWSSAKHEEEQQTERSWHQTFSLHTRDEMAK